MSANEARLRERSEKEPNISYNMFAAGESPGEQVMNITPQLTTCSLLPMGAAWDATTEKVRVVTIDSPLASGPILQHHVPSHR